MTRRFASLSLLALSFISTAIARAEYSIRFSGDVTEMVGLDAGSKFDGTMHLNHGTEQSGQLLGTGLFSYRSGDVSIEKAIAYRVSLTSIVVSPAFDELRIDIFEPNMQHAIANFHLEAAPEDMLPNKEILLMDPSVDWFRGGVRDLTLYDPANDPTQTSTSYIVGRLTQLSPVPEPASILTFAGGLGALCIRRLRRLAAVS